MQASSPNKSIGCIGKCTSGITPEELDYITDNINNTLSHPKGREIFKKFSERFALQSSIECLELYEICCESLTRDSTRLQSEDSDLEFITMNVMTVREIAEDLDGVPQIDMVLMKQFNEALEYKTKELLLAVLQETRDRTQIYLKQIHQHFKQYVSEPCPLTK